MKKSYIYRLCAVIVALLVWQGVSMAVNSDMLLASPIQVITRLFSLIFEKKFLSTVAFSFIRIIGGFLCAFVFGIIAAIAAGRFSVVEYLLWPFVVTIKSVPVASFIIMFLIWFTFNQLTIFISFLIAFPIIYSNVLQGIKSANKNLKEVADLYNVPWKRRLIYMYIPSIKPFLITACGLAVGMSWKSGVAAEVIGIVTGSIGEKLYESKIYFLNADLLAWTLVIILLSILSEKIFMFVLKKIFKMVERV